MSLFPLLLPTGLAGALAADEFPRALAGRIDAASAADFPPRLNRLASLGQPIAGPEQ